MTSSTLPRRRAPLQIRWHPAVARYAPVVVIVAAIIAIWYVAAILMNMNIVRDAFERDEIHYTTGDLIAGTLNAERPLLPAPHQIIATFSDDVFGWPITSPRSLVYHGWVTLSATFVGFLLGASFGMILAVLIVHARTLEKSLLPWIICSQMVPILAVAPIVIVVLGSIGLRGLLPKAIISAYLCFFPVTIGVVKGLTSPDTIQLDLMRTWSATPVADILETALAVVGAVPVHQPESVDHHLADRRHRRRAADRRAGRHRRAAARRLLLRTDGPDLGGAGCRLDPGGRADRHRRPDPALGGAAHG